MKMYNGQKSVELTSGKILQLVLEFYRKQEGAGEAQAYGSDYPFDVKS